MTANIHQPLPPNDDPMIKSYLKLRRLLGWLGILLPFFLIAGSLFQHVSIQNSISAFYYTAMRDLFVGTLAAMGLFLICYPGYKEPDDKLSESLITTIGGIAVLLVGAFPTGTYEQIQQACTVCPSCIPSVLNIFGWYMCCHNAIVSGAHLACAALFFFIMGYMSAIRFVKIRKPDGTYPKQNELYREEEKLIYKICGYTVWVCLAVMFLYFILVLIVGESKDPFKSFPMLFVFESIGLIAFGIAWLRKGKEKEKESKVWNFVEKRLLAKKR